jgi:hypothetical protein
LFDRIVASPAAQEAQSKLIDAQHRASLVNRSMAVGAQDSQITQGGLNRSRRLRERAPVVNLGNVTCKAGVCVLRDESAGLAFEFTACVATSNPLCLGDPGFAFSPNMKEHSRLPLDHSDVSVSRLSYPRGRRRPVGPSTVDSFPFEKLEPFGSTDRDLLRKPSNHVRCRFTIVGPCRPQSGVRDNLGAVPVGQHEIHDGIVRDKPLRLGASGRQNQPRDYWKRLVVRE